MKNSKHQRGYLPKIEYYQSLMNIAIMELDNNRIQYLSTKLAYFIERQRDLIDMKKFEGRRTN
jgi:hypothetical protein